MTNKKHALLIFLVATTLRAAQPATAPIDAGDANAQQSLVKLEPAAQVTQRLAWWSDAPRTPLQNTRHSVRDQ